MNAFAAAVRERFATRTPTVETARAEPVDRVVFDEALLARLRRLTLLSNRAVAQGLAGEHRSQRRGQSPEFADFKSYSHGDDFRRIDWNIYSRLGELFVRLSEVTTELNVHFLLDASASMQWSGDATRPTKFTYARRITGAVGYVSLWHFDRLTITPFTSQLGPRFGPAHGRSNITPMLTYLSNLEAGGTTSVAESIERYVRARRRPGILILCSDLLSGEPDDLRVVLRLVRSRGWQTTIVQIVDPAERDPSSTWSSGPDGQIPAIELIDLETASRMQVALTRSALAEYDRAWRTWQQQLETMCADEQIPLITLQTDWPFDTVVLGLLARQGMVG